LSDLLSFPPRRSSDLFHDLVELEAAGELSNSAGNYLFRHVEQTGMQLEILSNSQLSVEREVLRHIADASSGLDVVRIDLLPKEPDRKSTRLNSSHVKI